MRVREAAVAAPSATARSCAGIAEREEQADGDRLGVERAAASRGRAARSSPSGPTRPRDAEAALERDERLAGARRRAGRGARASCRRRCSRCSNPAVATNAVRAPLPLEQRVRGDVVPCANRSTRRRPTAARRGDDRLLLARRRRHLRGAQRAVVEQDGVRERAADVDAEKGQLRQLDQGEQRVRDMRRVQLALVQVADRARIAGHLLVRPAFARREHHHARGRAPADDLPSRGRRRRARASRCPSARGRARVAPRARSPRPRRPLCRARPCARRRRASRRRSRRRAGRRPRAAPRPPRHPGIIPTPSER